MAYDNDAYMLDCATRLKDIGHTEEVPKFARISGLTQLEEFLSNISKLQFPALLVHNNHEGRLGDPGRSDNYLDSPYFVFYVVKHAEYDNHDAQQEAKESCKNIGFKIIARMLRDKRNPVSNAGLMFLDFSNIPYQTIGPIGDNCFGVMFSFTVADTANITYNADDWE